MLEQLVSLITDIGFPFAVCIICFWYINKKDENHKEEIKHLSESLESNTSVMNNLNTLIQKMLDRMGGE